LGNRAAVAEFELKGGLTNGHHDGRVGQALLSQGCMLSQQLASLRLNRSQSLLVDLNFLLLLFTLDV
jgi:hypothetical protein